MVMAMAITNAAALSPTSVPYDMYARSLHNERELLGGSDAYWQNEIDLCALPITNDACCGFLYWVSRYWYIPHKITNKPVLLVPNHAQLALMLSGSKQNIELKSRKHGLSSIIIAKYFWRCLFQVDTHAYILAHVNDSTDELYNRVWYGFDRLVVPMKPEPKTSSKKQLKFKHNGSFLRFLTAGGKGLGRAADIHCALLSECAFYPDYDKACAGIEEGAIAGEAYIDKESTPNGYNEFRRDYTEAKANGGEFKTFFFPWYRDPTNRIALSPNETLDYTDDEIKAAQLYNLKPEQMKWRRAKIKQRKGLFKQEYPENDIECFLTSGIPRFDNEILTDLYAWLEENVRPIDIRGKGPLGGSDNGRFTVWQMPVEGRRYIAGCDVAEGVADGAYSVCTVIDAEACEQVAEWHGHYNPYEWGKIILPRIGRFYNNALLAIERNNHGHATIAGVKESGYPYIYKHKSYDQRSNGTVKKLGWPTDSKTRPQMIDYLDTVLREGSYTIYSSAFIAECMAFRQGDEDEDADNETVRRTKEFRDRIFSNGIALMVRRKGLPVVC